MGYIIRRVKLADHMRIVEKGRETWSRGSVGAKSGSLWTVVDGWVWWMKR